jgi:hypothetical protein
MSLDTLYMLCLLGETVSSGCGRLYMPPSLSRKMNLNL